MFESLRQSIARIVAPSEKQAVDFAGDRVAIAIAENQGHSKSGVKRNTAAILNAYNTSTWLHAVVHRIATSFAGIEWTVSVAVNERGDRMRSKLLQRAPMSRRKQLRKQLEVVELPEHPMLDLLEFGNPVMDGHTVMQMEQSYMDLRGEFFTVKQRSPMGAPVALWPVPPSWVKDVPTISFPFYVIDARGFEMNVPRPDVIWGRDPDPVDPYGRASGTVQALSDEIDSDEYAAQFIKSFFKNNAMPDAFVGIEGATAESVRQFQAAWEQKNRGPQKAHRISFFNKEPKVVKLGAEFKDNALVELRKFERDSIMQAFGIPPELLGVLTNSNRATIDAAETLFARWTLTPRAERKRIIYQNQLAPDFDERLIVGFVSPVPDDKEHQLNVAKAQSWALTRGEWREMSGLEPHEEGDDVYLQPVNLVPISAGDSSANVAPPTDGGSTAPAADRALTRQRNKTITPADLDALERIVDEQLLLEETEDIMRQGVEQFGQRMLDRLGVNLSFNLVNPRILQHLREYAGDRIVEKINATTKQALRATLAEGTKNGEDIPKLAKRVQSVMTNRRKFEAVRIARTEVLRSSNFANVEGMRQSGIIAEHQWLTTLDGRERGSHRAMNLQKRKIAEDPFVIPPHPPEVNPRTGTTQGPFDIGATADAPGDFGIARQDINCRCTTIPVVDLPTVSVREAQAIQKGQAELDIQARVGWEAKLAVAFRRAFRRQQAIILDKLEQLGR